MAWRSAPAVGAPLTLFDRWFSVPTIIVSSLEGGRPTKKEQMKHRCGLTRSILHKEAGERAGREIQHLSLQDRVSAGGELLRAPRAIPVSLSCCNY